MATAEKVRATLRASWHLSAVACTQLPAALHSAAWAVTGDGWDFVAKLVPAARRIPFEAGLGAAEHLVGRGVPAAAAVRAVDGALTVRLGGQVLALLRSVPGRPLEAVDPLDQQWWGDALGAAHRRLAAFRHPGLGRFHAIRPDAPHLGIVDWLRPAVGDALTAVRRLCVTDQLTYGVLHGDPAPQAFRIDPQTGRLGLVDWGPATLGPLTYDVASAVMYAGGVATAGDLIDAYLAAGPVPAEELWAALPTMLRFRWAVHADHFAARLFVADGGDLREAVAARTGADESWQALQDARDALTSLAGGSAG